MTAAYVDTSILGAYYCPEPSSAKAERALRETTDRAISWLTEVELFSLVAKKVRRRELTESEARRVLETFLTHITDGYYRRVALTAEHYTQARALIAKFADTLHTLDALHLAIALSQQLPLLTGDIALARAAKKQGLAVAGGR